MSLHGKVGLIATVLVAIAPMLGILSFRKLGILTKLPAEWHPIVKWTHRMVRFMATAPFYAFTTLRVIVFNFPDEESRSLTLIL